MTSSQGACCAEHAGEPLQFYCLEDEVEVCSYCLLVGRHTNHKHVPVELAHSSDCARLRTQVQELGERRKALSKALSQWELGTYPHGCRQECRAQELCSALKAVAAEAKGFGLQQVGQLDELHACIQGLGDLCEAQLRAARGLMDREGPREPLRELQAQLLVNLASLSCMEHRAQSHREGLSSPLPQRSPRCHGRHPGTHRRKEGPQNGGPSHEVRQPSHHHGHHHHHHNHHHHHHHHHHREPQRAKG
eukprot:RCo024026